MDWSDQTQRMMRTWAETQQKMWSSWLEGLQRAGQAPGPELWERTVETWRESVNRTLDAQAEWTQAWAARFQEIEGTPKEARDWAEEGQAMMSRWNEAQRELWGQWFDVLKSARPDSVLGRSGEAPEQLIRAWQETARKAMEAQMQWASAWSGGTASASRGARKGGGGQKGGS